MARRIAAGMQHDPWLVAELFERLRNLGYRRAFAGIALPNASSAALHCAVGFSRIGVFERIGYKFGAWHDVAWYQRDSQPPRTRPAELLKPDGYAYRLLR